MNGVVTENFFKNRVRPNESNVVQGVAVIFILAQTNLLSSVIIFTIFRYASVKSFQKCKLFA